MFRKWAHGLVVGLLLGSLFVAFPAAQNYVWSSINGVPMAPGMVITTGGSIRTGASDGNTLSLAAYDVDGAAYTPLLTLTAGNTPDLRINDGNKSLFRAYTNTIEMGSIGTYLNVYANLLGGDPSSFGLGANTVLGWTGGSAAWNNDTVIGREAAAILQLGVDVNGAAVPQTLKAHDGITGTDIAGANLILAGGRGTGAGAPGNLIFQTATALGSGTTAQTLATRLIIGATGAATFGTTAGTGVGAVYAGSYFVGTTAGADCTSAAAVTVAKGIVTGCSEPVPNPLTQDEVNQLRGLLNKQ